MSNIKISELTEATEANENDLLMIIQNGENKKIKASKVGTGQAGGGGDTLPIGAVIRWDSDVLPKSGEWLWLDTEYKETDYPELAEFCGGRFNLETTPTGYFRTPKSSGLVGVGKDINDTDFDTLGKTGGEKTHTLTVNEMPSHKHNDGVLPNEYFGEASGSNSCVVKADKSVGSTSATGGGQPHNNLQPYLVTNFIIKAKNTAVVKGDVIQEDGTASETNVYSSVAMDNKIQSLKRVTLYENASGTNTTLTLNDSVANYEDIEIFYKSNDNAYSSVKVNNANNKNIVLVNMTPNTTNNVLYVKATIVKAQNDSITVVDGLEGYGSGGITAGNKNYIVKVVGYKEV